MRTKLIRAALLAVTLTAILALTLSPLQAQDNSGSMDGKVVCDSTLITLVYLAESQYGYHPNIAMGDMTVEFDYGQFTPWFDAMMAQMDANMDDTMMEETMTEEPMMGDTMMEDTTMLTPGIIQGEDMYCTDLRADVEQYLYDHISSELMAEQSGN